MSLKKQTKLFIIMALDKEKHPKKNSKTLIAILLAVIIGGIAMYYGYENQQLNLQKKNILTDLAKSQDSLDIAINENTSIKEELIVEKQKLSNLIEEVKASEISLKELDRFKAEVLRLRKQVTILKKEKLQLVEKYDALKMSQDSTKYALEIAASKNEKLEVQNTDMNKMIRKSNKVSFVNLKVETLKQGLSGGAIATDKAVKVNILAIKFTIIGTKLTSPIVKEYFVQIMDENDVVIGEKLSKKFGPIILDYSYSSRFKYDGENIDVSADIKIPNSKVGKYIVTIFDKTEPVLKTSFVLK